MKQIHNIRLQTVCKSEQEAQEALQALENLFELELKKHYTIEKIPGETLTLYVCKVWLDRQGTIRTVLKALQEKLSGADKQFLTENAKNLLTERKHVAFRVETKKLAEGKLALTSRPGTQIKLNIAAFPKTQGNVVKVIQALFN